MLAYLVVLAACCWCITGCGGGQTDVPTVTVTGVVNMDGRPLADAAIYFNKAGSTYMGTGKTNALGEYEVKAEVGDNTVTFNKEEASELSEEEQALADMDEMSGAGGEEGVGSESKSLIPEKYTSEGIPFKVPDGGTDTGDFELTSEE
jgi:hypothetical protein